MNKIEKEQLSWESVEKYLDEKTDAGNAMALIETEKIFAQALKKLGFPGKDADKQVEALSFVFTDYNALKSAREYNKKLAGRIGQEVPREIAEKALSVYYQAISDLINFKKKKFSAFRKIKLYLKLLLPHPKSFVKKFVLTIFIFFLLIFILDSTSFGRSIVDFFVLISHLIFSWVLFVILLIAGIAILVIGTVYYFESRRKK